MQELRKYQNKETKIKKSDKNQLENHNNERLNKKNQYNALTKLKNMI